MAFLMGKDPDAPKKDNHSGELFAMGLERGRMDAEKKNDEKKKKKEDEKEKRKERAKLDD